MGYNKIRIHQKKRSALVAHDNKKQDLQEWAKWNRELLINHDLYATGTTGKLLEEVLGTPVNKFQSGPLGGDQQMIIAKNTYTVGQREWGLMLDNDNLFRFYVSQKGWKTLAAQTTPQPGHWYHIAVTVDNGQGRIYVNGKQEGAGLLAPSIPATDAPLSIGGVQNGQRLMQTTPDIFLGHIRANFSDTEYHDFYFRQFHDGKASVNLEMIDDIKRASTYMNICAWTLARAHARSGDRAAIASYLGNNDSFDRAIATWAMAYREQNSADYASYQAAIASGRITVAPAPEG